MNCFLIVWIFPASPAPCLINRIYVVAFLCLNTLLFNCLDLVYIIQLIYQYLSKKMFDITYQAIFHICFFVLLTGQFICYFAFTW